MNLKRETVGERLQHNCKEMEHEMRTELDYDDVVEGAVGLKNDDFGISRVATRESL